MSLFDLVQEQLGPQQIQQIAQQIGADPSTTGNAVEAALPMMLGGMADTARQPGGAQTLGGLAGQQSGLLEGLGGLGGLGAILGGAGGGGILGSILGRREPQVENGVQQASGLNGDQTRKLLMILAPIVLAALARRRQQQRPAAAGPMVDSDNDGIPDELEREAQHAQTRVEQRNPQLGGIIGSILNAATRR